MSSKTPTDLGESFGSKSSSLQLPSDGGGTDTLSIPPRQAYYVIVGRGVTALYNHMTLLDKGNAWGAKRLGGLPVMHLGYVEPWSRRKGERMGQWPHMLDFFRRFHPSLGLGSATAKDWLPASTFASMLKRVEDYLCNQYTEVERDIDPIKKRFYRRALVLQSGFVGLIEPKSGFPVDVDTLALEKARRDGVKEPEKPDDAAVWHNPDAPFRLSVYHDGKHCFIYARKIDICTGPGEPRLFGRGNFESDELYDEHLPIRGKTPEDPTPWRRLVNGNEYIGSTIRRNKTVLIMKGNPVGAQSVQSALNMPDGGQQTARWAFWVHNKALRGCEADVPGRRNLVEIVGNSKLAKDEIAALRQHHGAAVIESGDTVERVREDLRLKAKLYRAGGHEPQKISVVPKGELESEPRLKCTFVTVGRDRKDMVEEAKKSLQAMIDDAGSRFGTSHGIPDITVAGDVITSIVADQIVYALGQERASTAEGTAAYMVQLLGGTKSIYTSAATFPSGVMGVIDSDPAFELGEVGCLRVLGGAMLDGPGMVGGERNTLVSKHKEHGDSLPQEGPAGGGGLNLATPNIRRANRYEVPPWQVNTSSVTELVGAGLSEEGAPFIVSRRSETDRGLTIAELIEMLTLRSQALLEVRAGLRQEFIDTVNARQTQERLLNDLDTALPTLVLQVRQEDNRMLASQIEQELVGLREKERRLREKVVALSTLSTAYADDARKLKDKSLFIF